MVNSNNDNINTNGNHKMLNFKHPKLSGINVYVHFVKLFKAVTESSGT